MANYQSKYTGAQIDEAVAKANASASASDVSALTGKVTTVEGTPNVAATNATNAVTTANLALGTANTALSKSSNKLTCLIPRPVADNYYNGKTIALIGDSVTAGVGATGTTKRYASVVASLLGATEKNLGASGTVMCTGGHRSCNISKLTASNIRGANVVTIMMGLNDWDQAVKDGYFGGTLTYDASKTYYHLGEFGTDDTTTIYGAVKMWCDRIVELKAMSEFAK